MRWIVGNGSPDSAASSAQRDVAAGGRHCSSRSNARSSDCTPPLRSGWRHTSHGSPRSGSAELRAWQVTARPHSPFPRRTLLGPEGANRGLEVGAAEHPRHDVVAVGQRSPAQPGDGDCFGRPHASAARATSSVVDGLGQRRVERRGVVGRARRRSRRRAPRSASSSRARSSMSRVRAGAEVGDQQGDRCSSTGSCPASARSARRTATTAVATRRSQAAARASPPPMQ